MVSAAFYAAMLASTLQHEIYEAIVNNSYSTNDFVPGLRGAIAFALCLHLEFGEESRRVLVTTTLIIVLFTVLVLGGSTAPLMKVRTLFSCASHEGTYSLLVRLS